MLAQLPRWTAMTGALCISGCNFIGEVNFMPPTVAKATDRKSLATATDYTERLSLQYLTSAGYIVNEEQIFDVPTIGATALATTAAALSWGTRTITLAAVGAGGAYALRTYYDGDARAKALVNGALALRCVSTVAQEVAAAATIIQPVTGQLSDTVDVVQAWDAIDQIENRVFQVALTRSPPDYTSLAKTMAAQIEVAQTVQPTGNAVIAGRKKILMGNKETASDAAATETAETAAAKVIDGAPAQFTACIAKAG